MSVFPLDTSIVSLFTQDSPQNPKCQSLPLGRDFISESRAGRYRNFNGWPSESLTGRPMLLTYSLV